LNFAPLSKDLLYPEAVNELDILEKISLLNETKLKVGTKAVESDESDENWYVDRIIGASGRVENRLTYIKKSRFWKKLRASSSYQTKQAWENQRCGGKLRTRLSSRLTNLLRQRDEQQLRPSWSGN